MWNPEPVYPVRTGTVRTPTGTVGNGRKSHRNRVGPRTQDRRVPKSVSGPFGPLTTEGWDPVVGSFGSQKVEERVCHHRLDVEVTRK